MQINSQYPGHLSQDTQATDLLAEVAEALEAAQRLPESAPTMSARRRLYAALSHLGAWIDQFAASRLSPAEVQAVRTQVIEPLRTWSRGSRFFQNAYAKPRGYPGDFNTIELIYRNQPAGDDLRGLILDDCYLHTVACQSVRNRLDFLVTRLRAETQRRRASATAPVAILSLGSGPARELALLSADPAFAQSVAVTCVDLDSCALDYAARLLRETHLVRVSYVHDNVLRYAAGSNRPAQRFDVIYAAGLFDYLDAARATGLLNDLHGLLKSDGTLIVGNFSLETPAGERSMLDWLFEWPLIYRNEASYQEIFAHTSFGTDNLLFEYEPLCANMFAILT